MRQGNSDVRQRLVQFQRPLLQTRHQAPRPFVGLVEVHVVEWNTDPQAFNDLDRFIRRSFFFGHKSFSRDRFQDLWRICRRHIGEVWCLGNLRQKFRLTSRHQWKIIRLILHCTNRRCFGAVDIHGNGRRRLQIWQLQVQRQQLAYRCRCCLRLVQSLGEHGEIDILGHRRCRRDRVWRYRGEFRRHLGFSKIRHQCRKLIDCARIPGFFRRQRIQRWLDGLQASVGRICCAWRGLQRHLRLHHIGCNGCHCSPRHHERQQAAVKAHSISRFAECLRRPGRCSPCSNVISPTVKCLQTIGRQLQQSGLHGFLLSQPSVQHLLHRPGCLTKIIEPHHA